MWKEAEKHAHACGNIMGSKLGECDTHMWPICTLCRIKTAVST